VQAVKRGLTTSCNCATIERINKINQETEINEIGNRYDKLIVIKK